MCILLLETLTNKFPRRDRSIGPARGAANSVSRSLSNSQTNWTLSRSFLSLISFFSCEKRKQNETKSKSNRFQRDCAMQRALHQAPTLRMERHHQPSICSRNSTGNTCSPPQGSGQMQQIMSGPTTATTAQQASAPMASGPDDDAASSSPAAAVEKDFLKPKSCQYNKYFSHSTI